jgi:replicative DNA helicase Mcm
MLQVHDSAARWRSFFEETSANEISNFAAQWPEKTGFLQSFEDVQSWDPRFAELILNHPRKVIEQGETVLTDLCATAGHDAEPKLLINHLPPDSKVELRDVGSERVEQFISSEVIVTKVSELKPRIYNAHFKCSCDFEIEIPQPNELELIEPLECPEGLGCGRKTKGANAVRIELIPEKSSLVDNQWIEIQELPENIQGGANPARMHVLAEGDLAGTHAPGNRITVNAIPYIRTQKKAGQKTPMFDTYLSLISSEHRNTPLEEVIISDEDIQAIQDLASRDDIFEVMIRSIAPSIYATDQLLWVKRSLVLQLFGGVPRKQADGTRTRGDIHILLMGDPGVAKSQLLKFMGNLSPRGKFTTGGGTTAAGLTAAAVRDTFNDGRFSLEAGALVLADLGLCAVDEFDKMSPQDRGAMHEAMEQQLININKGGLSASMRTRCAILAAANPRTGKFKPRGANAELPFDEVDLLPAMLSRFDVIWLIRDEPEASVDERIAQHIIRTRRSGVPEHLIDTGMAVDPLYVSEARQENIDINGEEIIPTQLLKKYIAYSKRRIFPSLNDEAMDHLVEFYKTSRRRKENFDGVTQAYAEDAPRMTARTLEGLVRISEAHARLYLREEATIEDAKLAIAVVKHWRHAASGDEFDEITLRTGVTRNKRSAERVITSVVRNLIREMGGECTTTDVYNVAIEQGFDEETADRVLSTLHTRGTLFSPRLGLWRLS